MKPCASLGGRFLILNACLCHQLGNGLLQIVDAVTHLVDYQICKIIKSLGSTTKLRSTATGQNVLRVMIASDIVWKRDCCEQSTTTTQNTIISLVNYKTNRGKVSHHLLQQCLHENGQVLRVLRVDLNGGL